MHRPFTGRHVLAELVGVEPMFLDDETAVGSALRESLTEAGASVLSVHAERFEPQGVTVVAVLSESHASVHTWPEHRSAFVDVFTCGDAADPALATRLLARRMGAEQVRLRTVERGGSHPAASDPAASGPAGSDPAGADPTAASVPAGSGPAGPARRVDEPLGPGLRRLWDVEEVLWSGRTAFQEVLIGRTAHGVTLFCDDERQSSEASQLVYHEALLVPALLLAAGVDRVLVVGSSEGVVSELAVRAGAGRVDHVDIDTECVRLCARLLPYGYTEDGLTAAESGTGPVRVHYADGWEYLRTTGRRYDVVVIDLPDERPDDPDAQHNRLYGTEFLALASSVLAPGGVLVGQVGCPTLWRNDTLRTAIRRYREVFPTVVHYGSDEHEWSFFTGCPTPVDDPVARMIERLATLPYRPETIDADALRRGAVLPHSLR